MRHKVFSKLLIMLGFALSLTAVIPSLGFTVEISVYTINDKVLADPLIEKLIKITGIKIQYIVMPCGVLFTRVQAEKPNIQADMVLTMAIDGAIIAKREGLFLPYLSKAWETISAEFKDPDGHYYISSCAANMFMINKERMKKAGLTPPKSWYDLVDPKWKGEIIWPNPMTSSSAYLALCGLVRLMGEDAAFEYLGKLHPNIREYTKSGAAPAVMVSRGEAILGMGDTTSTYACIREGYPIEAVILKEGFPYQVAVDAIFSSTKDPKKLEACKKIIDHMILEKIQILLGKYRPIVARPGIVSLQDTYGKIPAIKGWDHVWVSENRIRISKKWEERFLKK